MAIRIGDTTLQKVLMMRVLVLRLGLMVVVPLSLSAGCFQPRAISAGRREVTPVTPIGPVMPPPGGSIGPQADATAPSPGPLDAGMMAAECTSVRGEARRVLQTNCATCHQAPANQANFSFCLDVDKLAMSVSSTGKKFLVPGSPEQSRIFERVANGEMPPAAIKQRPTEGDLAVLRKWISTCVELGVGGFGPLDGGVSPDVAPAEPDPGPGCGKSRQPCCEANTCQDGGCCVLGFCRGNGQACTGGPGGNDIPGMCSNGSCVDRGVTCGSLTQPCCGVVASCTGNQAVCAGGTCQACGQIGGRCCKNGGRASCIDGATCVGQTLVRDGQCEACGKQGQACCGTGAVASRTCNGTLTCIFNAGVASCQPAAAPPEPGRDGGARG
jgi:hypothetical protein